MERNLAGSTATSLERFHTVKSFPNGISKRFRGFTAKIAPNARVKSPTFALVHEYKGETLSVFHFDMYRIDGEDDLYSIGFYDYLDRRGVCLVEWSEKIPFALPSRYLRAEIVKSDPEGAPDRRQITVTLVEA